MRIGVLTQWYDPEPGPAALPGTLARGLAARGHEVEVLTGFPNYPTGRLADGYSLRPRMHEERDGISVTRVALYPSHSRSARARLLNYGSFGATAATLGLPALRGLDAVWVNYSPITVAPAMLLARHALGAPVVCHVLDLWPDTLEASGVSADTTPGRVALGGAGAVARAMYRSAATVAYISPGVGPLLRARGVPESKLAYAPMWADESAIDPHAADLRAELGIERDRVVLLYAGALGEAQGLDTLVEACRRVEGPRLLCLVAGSGTHEDALRARASDLANVRFLGRVPSERMPALVATADASFIGLNDHPLARATMPSKTQALLAAGSPLVVAGSGDVAQVARESGAAWTVPSGDPGALAAALRELCAAGADELAVRRDAALRYYDSTFSARAGIDRIEELLLGAAATKKRIHA